MADLEKQVQSQSLEKIADDLADRVNDTIDSFLQRGGEKCGGFKTSIYK